MSLSLDEARLGLRSDEEEIRRGAVARLTVPTSAGEMADAIDVLISASGTREELRAPRIHDGEHVHGTGCALSAAIAAYLANGRELADACRLAKDYVRDRIASPVRPGRGAPAVV